MSLQLQSRFCEHRIEFQHRAIAIQIQSWFDMTQYFNQSEDKSRRQVARASMPKAEVMLWSVLKGRKMLGCKFRRQYGVSAYRIDFYCAELQLGIELDGESHYVGNAPGQDRHRQDFIESLGIRVLRFLNSDVY